MKKVRKVKTMSLVLAVAALLSVCSFVGCTDNGNSYTWKCTSDSSSYVKGNKSSMSSSNGSVQLTKFYFPGGGFIVTGGANYKKSGNKFTSLYVTTGRYANQDLASSMSVTCNSSCSEIYVNYQRKNYTYR